MPITREETFVSRGKLVEVFTRRSRSLTPSETKGLKIQELQRRLDACKDKQVSDYFQSYVDYLKK